MISAVLSLGTSPPVVHHQTPHDLDCKFESDICSSPFFVFDTYAKPDVLHLVLLGAHLQHESLWVCSRTCCSTMGSGDGQQHCQDTAGGTSAWSMPQPSQAVALHRVDTAVDGLSFGRVYCNSLGGSKKLPSWW